MRLDFILSGKAEKFIIAVIIINAITLGMETSQTLVNNYGSFLLWADHIALGIFTAEILLKIFCLRLAYFKDPWNIFDFLIIGASWLPIGGGLTVLRSLRVLRVLLLISAMPRLRLIVRSLIISLPSIGSIALLLCLVFYVSAVIATKIFGQAFPDWFGTLGESLFTLFQLMTLESWAMGIVRPVCEQFPYASFFFVPFVLISAFIILNVFIAIIINAMDEANDNISALNQSDKPGEDECDRIYQKLVGISQDIKILSEDLRKIKTSLRKQDN